MDINVSRQSLHVSSVVDTGNEIDVTTTSALDTTPPHNTHAMQTQIKSEFLNQKPSTSQRLSQLPHHTLKPPSIS